MRFLIIAILVNNAFKRIAIILQNTERNGNHYGKQN